MKTVWQARALFPICGKGDSVTYQFGPVNHLLYTKISTALKNAMIGAQRVFPRDPLIFVGNEIHSNDKLVAYIHPLDIVEE